MPSSSTSFSSTSKLLNTGIRNPFFFFLSAPSKSRRIPVGLGLIADEDSISAGPELTRRIVVFGSYQLKIQTPNYCACSGESPGIYCGRPPPPEMEQSEEYTCVISHGPNPRTTHIFGKYCVIDESSNSSSSHGDGRREFAADHFLSFCCRCKRRIGSREDVFMYRGEKAFCSDACREEEIWFEEEKEERSTARNL